MRRAVASSLLIFSCAGAGAPGGEPPPPGGPRIVFDETVHEFGVIEQGDAVSHVFSFRNEGGDTLIVRDLRPSCGCTASTASSPIVGPGETGAIRVTFNSAGKIGRIRKTVLVLTNDTHAAPPVLVVWSRVVARRVHPEDAEMSARPGGRAALEAGASLFEGECRTCHVIPAEGKRGRALYDAACAMCHGNREHPAVAEAPALTGSRFLAARTDTEVSRAIAEGTGHVMMPGFARAHGGVLDEEQIASLVAYFRLIRPSLPIESVPPTPHH